MGSRQPGGRALSRSGTVFRNGEPATSRSVACWKGNTFTLIGRPDPTRVGPGTGAPTRAVIQEPAPPHPRVGGSGPDPGSDGPSETAFGYVIMVLGRRPGPSYTVPEPFVRISRHPPCPGRVGDAPAPSRGTLSAGPCPRLPIMVFGLLPVVRQAVP